MNPVFILSTEWAVSLISKGQLVRLRSLEEKASHCLLCWELSCLPGVMLPITIPPQGTFNVLMGAERSFKLSSLN